MKREEQRQQWLSDYFVDKAFEVAVASADASFRSYYRITTSDSSFILMDAPPEQEDCRPFVAVSNLLLSHDICVPKLFDKDLKNGFLLLEDFGSSLYLDMLNQQSVKRLYPAAIDSILKIQSIKQVDFLPQYDSNLLMNEMDLFKVWFIGHHLDVELSQSDDQILSDAFGLFTDNALEQPQVMVHRDYHSRNLMITSTLENEEFTPGIIDFQDAVYGPFTYDLASLLKDCYINWPGAIVNHYCQYFLTQYNHRFDTDIKLNQFIQWFDFMAAQRHLKAIGIFSRLKYRDNKPDYLHDIPRTMNYLLKTCTQYPDLESLGHLLDKLQPNLKTHS